jgi:hypothetical protein
MRNFCDMPKKITWQVISDSESMNNPKRIPLELQYAMAIHPSRHFFVKKILEQGHGLALGKYPKAENQVLKAVKIIAATHYGALYPWLEDLVVNNITPVFSEADLEDASLQGIDLLEQVAIIKNHVSRLVQVKIVESGAQALSLEDKKMISAMARDIQKIHSLQATEYLYRQSIHQKKHTALLLVIGFMIFAPIVHGLELLFSGLGVFAALLLPNLLIQATGAVAAYNHGTAVWQIKTHFKKHWPEIIILILGAILVQYFLSLGLLLLAGIVFALSAPILVLAQAMRRLLRAKNIFALLASEGKMTKSSLVHWAKIYYGSYGIIYLFGLISAVIATALIFRYFSQYLHNGWVLMVLAVLYYPLSDLLTALWSKTADFRLKKRLRSLLQKAIIY